MLKRSILFVLLVSTMSFLSSVGWAQKKIPGKFTAPSVKTSFPKRTSVSKQAILSNPSLLSVSSNQLLLRKPWTSMATTAPTEAQVHRRCLEKMKKIQRRYYEQELAKHPPLIGENVQLYSAKLAYKGVEFGALKRGERIVMGSAFDTKGKLVVHLKGTLPNGDPIPSHKLENALMGYDIETIMLMVRSKATLKKPAQSRVVTYRVSTGEVTNSVK